MDRNAEDTSAGRPKFGCQHSERNECDSDRDPVIFKNLVIQNEKVVAETLIQEKRSRQQRKSDESERGDLLYEHGVPPWASDQRPTLR